MTLPQNTIGVDVSKGWIDAFFSASSTHRKIPMTDQDLAHFAREAAGALVVFEASGGYEHPLTEALVAAGVAFARVNPRQAREFARACGTLAKTDRVDARVLARMGRAVELTVTVPPSAERAELAALVARRADLSGMIRAEKNRAGTCRDPWTAEQIAHHVNMLDGQLQAVNARIAALVEGCADLAEQGARLASVPGIGPALSAVLLARLPELGHLDHRRITSLAGLAPHACDSGLHRGKRRIWGGRADARRALYLAAFLASRFDPTLRAFRQRLQAAGKPPKVAITACARKLLTILNAMFRHKKDYRKQTA